MKQKIDLTSSHGTFKSIWMAWKTFSLNFSGYLRAILPALLLFSLSLSGLIEALTDYVSNSVQPYLLLSTSSTEEFPWHLLLLPSDHSLIVGAVSLVLLIFSAAWLQSELCEAIRLTAKKGFFPRIPQRVIWKVSLKRSWIHLPYSFLRLLLWLAFMAAAGWLLFKNQSVYLLPLVVLFLLLLVVIRTAQVVRGVQQISFLKSFGRSFRSPANASSLIFFIWFLLLLPATAIVFIPVVTYFGGSLAEIQSAMIFDVVPVHGFTPWAYFLFNAAGIAVLTLLVSLHVWSLAFRIGTDKE
ncbi:MAG: hypothetical protein ACI3YC_00590 [Alloprevotella sp.]